MKKNYRIRQFKKGEEDKVLKLIKPVFNRFVAPAFSHEGVEEFLKAIQTQTIRERLGKGDRKILFAEEKNTEKIIGLIELKNFNHISLFFVKSEYQGKGIGKDLIKMSIKICKQNIKDLNKITVYASPNAVEIYEKLGFKKIGRGKVQQKNGIRFIKMKLLIS